MGGVQGGGGKLVSRAIRIFLEGGGAKIRMVTIASFLEIIAILGQDSGRANEITDPVKVM